MTDCLFCNISPDRIIASNELAYAIRDGYPVTKLHTLVIPIRHIPTFFELNKREHEACYALINDLRISIESEDELVTGFNIGINNGESAGQTIFHCHIHLIPRRKGDANDPRGGVRGVIVDKQKY
jgi:ATP adenylyltransferase